MTDSVGVSVSASGSTMTVVIDEEDEEDEDLCSLQSSLDELVSEFELLQNVKYTLYRVQELGLLLLDSDSSATTDCSEFEKRDMLESLLELVESCISLQSGRLDLDVLISALGFIGSNYEDLDSDLQEYVRELEELILDAIWEYIQEDVFLLYDFDEGWAFGLVHILDDILNQEFEDCEVLESVLLNIRELYQLLAVRIVVDETVHDSEEINFGGAVSRLSDSSISGSRVVDIDGTSVDIGYDAIVAAGSSEGCGNIYDVIDLVVLQSNKSVENACVGAPSGGSLISQVFDVSLQNPIKDDSSIIECVVSDVSDTVTMVIDADESYDSELGSFSCEWYDEDDEAWSSEGCSVTEDVDESSVTCSCEHLTDFAVMYYEFEGVAVEISRWYALLLTPLFLVNGLYVYRMEGWKVGRLGGENDKFKRIVNVVLLSVCLLRTVWTLVYGLSGGSYAENMAVSVITVFVQVVFYVMSLLIVLSWKKIATDDMGVAL